MKNNSSTLVVGLLLILAIGGGIYYSQSKSGETPSYEDTSVSAEETGTPPAGEATSGTYTMADVAAHGSEASCWSAVDGNVYDLTSWIANHPGGPGAILGICGADGTEKFHGQHGDMKRMADTLATFKIGTLAE